MGGPTPQDSIQPRAQVSGSQKTWSGTKCLVKTDLWQCPMPSGANTTALSWGEDTANAA